jgi:hypothetical protein
MVETFATRFRASGSNLLIESFKVVFNRRYRAFNKRAVFIKVLATTTANVMPYRSSSRASSVSSANKLAEFVAKFINVNYRVITANASGCNLAFFFASGQFFKFLLAVRVRAEKRFVVTNRTSNPVI